MIRFSVKYQICSYVLYSGDSNVSAISPSVLLLSDISIRLKTLKMSDICDILWFKIELVTEIYCQVVSTFAVLSINKIPSVKRVLENVLFSY